MFHFVVYIVELQVQRLALFSNSWHCVILVLGPGSLLLLFFIPLITNHNISPSLSFGSHSAVFAVYVFVCLWSYTLHIIGVFASFLVIYMKRAVDFILCLSFLHPALFFKSALCYLEYIIVVLKLYRIPQCASPTFICLLPA